MSTPPPGPVTAVVADDEPVAREGLRDALAGVTWLRCVALTGSGAETLEAVERLRPDVLFLDIQMPGGTGLEVMRRLQHRPFVVLTTAWAQHAVDAFELGAVDYLLKPFGEERLARALERVRAGLGEPREGVADRLQDALGQEPMRRLFVRAGATVVPVPVESLVHLEAWGDYVRAYTATSRHVVHVALHRLEQRLDPAVFLRVHRGHVVNLTHVRAFRSQGGGLLAAELSTGAFVPVSRTHARQVKRLAR